MTSHPRPDQLSISPAAATALGRATKMAIVTDEHDDHLAATRAAAVGLAEQFNLSVVLYDRSQETWMDTPHPSGPTGRNELDERSRGHLGPQLDEFEHAGVSAVAWISTVPSITEIVDVIAELGVDLVLLPPKLQHPKLLDRLKHERPADVVAHIAAMNLEHPVPVLIADSGEIALAAESG